MDNICEEGIIVAVRIRPLSKKELAAGIVSCCQTLGDSNIAIRKNGDASNFLKSQMAMLNEYAFDAVFDEDSTQEEVYESTAKKFIPNVINGKNVTVFAYGATGAGKTHTMLGNSRADASATGSGLGIIPSAVKDMFSLIARKYANADETSNIQDKWTVTLSYIEVYNEQVYDLLGNTAGKVLPVREDQTRDIVVVAGMTEQVVTTYDEVMVFMTQGNRNRKTEATMANAVSSRSHAVLQLVVRHSMLRLDTNKETVIESKLSLIDLAGSERASATNNRGARLQEGANINKSLLALANCINALAENAGSDKKSNVKFRDSKLTHLLKSSLEGNCNLIMIANINPSDTTYEDSNNTLKYANRAKNIKVNPVVQEVVKESTWVERELRLRQENATLRARVCELTKLLTEAQTFRDNVLHKCANEASLEDIKHLVDELDESFEAIRSSGSESDNSFSSDSVATSTEGSSPASSALSLSPDPTESIVVESFGRGKRRASMSAVPAPKVAATAAKVTKTVSSVAAAPVPVSAPVPVVAAAPVIVSANPEVPSEFEDSDITSMSCVTSSSVSTRRRQSSVPAPVARSTTRRASLAPKLSATAAALKAVAEIASAPVQPVSVNVAPSAKNASKITEASSRITRRKSLLSASAPTSLGAIAEVAEVCEKSCVADMLVIDDSTPDIVSADVESDRENGEVVADAVPAATASEIIPLDEVVSVSADKIKMPIVDSTFDDAMLQRRALQRRTSVGNCGSSSIPQLGEARSSRRKSIAQVTAMLASIDSISSLLKPSSSTSTSAATAIATNAEATESTTTSKKRAATVVAADAEELGDENVKRRRSSNSSKMSLSSVDEAPEHVWIDI